MWNLEGKIITATYLGDYPVTGKVVNSRVAYGGSVKHTIELSQPINIYGTDRDRLIIDHETITQLSDN